MPYALVFDLRIQAEGRFTWLRQSEVDQISELVACEPKPKIHRVLSPRALKGIVTLIFRSTDGSPDSHPESIGVELMVSNSKLPGKALQSLGILPLTFAAEQTLAFKISPHITTQSFDELTIRFRMEWWRGDKSANIAIQSFVLLPKS